MCDMARKDYPAAIVSLNKACFQRRDLPINNWELLGTLHTAIKLYTNLIRDVDFNVLSAKSGTYYLK